MRSRFRRKELEDFYEAEQAGVDAKAQELTAGERADYLTRTSISYTDKMMKRWDTLARLLIVKHNTRCHPPTPRLS